MYKISYFTETDRDEILSFIKENPFAVITGVSENQVVATQIPFLIEERNGDLFLRGHVMRKTDHHNTFEQNPEVLVLFTGPHCYVSSSWYKERNVGSTWNYMTVHARGQVRFLDDEGTTQIITDLTSKYEAGQKQPELVTHMPADYVKSMVKAIAGFEIAVTSMEAVFKLSQNRSDDSYRQIVAHLEALNDARSEAIAAEMINRRKQLFEK